MIGKLLKIKKIEIYKEQYQHLLHHHHTELSKPNLALLGLHDVADSIVDGVSACGSFNVEPVKDSALFNENVVHIHRINLADSSLIGKLARLGNDCALTYVLNVKVEEMVFCST